MFCRKLDALQQNSKSPGAVPFSDATSLRSAESTGDKRPLRSQKLDEGASEQHLSCFVEQGGS